MTSDSTRNCSLGHATEQRWAEEETPRVCIIIPNYNYSQYLPEAVMSALGQTYRRFEIVVVDDGSTDSSLEALRQFAADHPRVRVYRQENRGLAATRNTAISLSECEYILPLDSDDLIHPEYLEKTIPVLDAHPRLGLVYTQMVWFGEENMLRADYEYDFELLKRGNFITVTSLFRRQAWADAGGYDEELPGYEDWDLWIAMAERGWTGKLVREPLFYYRRHGTTMIARCDEMRDEIMAQIANNHPRAFSEGFRP